jgi:hypothetical protein
VNQHPETTVEQREAAFMAWRAVRGDLVGYGRTPLDAIVDLLNAERDAEQLAHDVCRTAGL